MAEVIHDVIIVGGGPIGIACAIEAKKAGLRAVVIEKGALVNSLFHYPLYMTFFSTAERLEIGGIPFNCLAPKPGRQEALEYYRNVKRFFGLDIRLFEKVVSVSKQRLFTVVSEKATYLAHHVVIATGFYDIPFYMGIPGENLDHVSHYFREAHEFAYRKVVVIGANNSSVDAALECWRKGADVTMVIRKDAINDRVKYWVKPDVENRIAEGSIKAYFNSCVTEIHERHITIQNENGIHEIEADAVLALTGYQPDFGFLERIGISLSQDNNRVPQHDPATMETNVPGLYLAGVVCGGMETHKWFIENSRIHAELIVTHILQKN